MRRIAIFCDGTWNRLDAPHPTNVVWAARAVLPVSDTGVQQVTYYNQGVGTSFTFAEGLERSLAGAFGLGLFDKIADAYRFLIFNFQPDDEIFIFGFSRGAFTARSLGGMIRKCGILRREHVGRIGEAFSLYKDHTVDVDSRRAIAFRQHFAHQAVVRDARQLQLEQQDAAPPLDLPPVAIKYVGVWDTVGALGIPSHLVLSDLLNTRERYRFYDPELSSIVEYARHAVAIDEDRRSFAPTLWTNLDTLEQLPGRAGHYEQLWFAGDHGSVGGGGDIVGLSRIALLWILRGASQAGLAVDAAQLAAAEAECDFLAPLRNVRKEPPWYRRLLDSLIFPRQARAGPTDIARIAPSARDRLNYRTSPPGGPRYRPRSLPGIISGLD